jgi:hypothetical protein
MSIFAALMQFIGYGIGFIISTININLFKRKPQKVFPFLFFKTK